ncbi:hypothetical protein Tco_1562865 [Tanacetum coccineum]
MMLGYCNGQDHDLEYYDQLNRDLAVIGVDSLKLKAPHIALRVDLGLTLRFTTRDLGRNRDLTRNCTFRKRGACSKVSPVRDKVLVYPDSDKEDEEIDVDNINDNTAREEEEDEVKVEQQDEQDVEVASTPVQVSDEMNGVMHL